MPFTRDEWARLREVDAADVVRVDLKRLRGLNEPVSVKEVVDIYLPLSRLLNLHVAATQELHAATAKFLGTTSAEPPYIIGVAGSVAVGKSTTSRLLRALLARWPDHPRVDLVTTDGFLLPNAVLQARGLMRRKGFPESYDLRRLVQFVSDIKSGVEEVRAPVYSHTRYDIVRRRVARRDAAGHPDPRGAERAAVGQPADVPVRSASSCPTSSTSRSTSTPTKGTSRTGTSSGS